MAYTALEKMREKIGRLTGRMSDRHSLRFLAADWSGLTLNPRHCASFMNAVRN